MTDSEFDNPNVAKAFCFQDGSLNTLERLLQIDREDERERLSTKADFAKSVDTVGLDTKMLISSGLVRADLLRYQQQSLKYGSETLVKMLERIPVPALDIHYSDNETSGPFVEIAEEARGSVGVVTVGLSEHNFLPIGTAWVAAPKKLATNAHVATDVVEALSRELPVWVTFASREGEAIRCRIQSTVIHPAFPDFLRAYLDKKVAIPGGDVAFLQTDDETPPQIPILQQGYENLRAGHSVAYLGYPSEKMAGGGVNLDRPSPNLQQGIISNMTDWDLNPVDYTDCYLITHNLGLTGGASGSPLLNTSGRVIGLVSAGNMVFVRVHTHCGDGEFVRIPSGVALNFAQRADLLLQILPSETRGA